MSSSLGISRSSALTQFKQRLGHTNQYLITLLIGAEGVRSGHVTKDDGFHTTWNPKSVEVAADLAAQFARKATLAWTIDALDGYLSALRKQSMAFTHETLRELLEVQSVRKKFEAAVDELSMPTDERVALIQLAIQWRNVLVHHGAGEKLEPKYRLLLYKQAERISDEFRHLDVGLLLDQFDKREAPRFKEVTSVVQATYSFVCDLDGAVLKFISPADYAEAVLSSHFQELPDNLSGVWSTHGERRERKLAQLLRTQGFVDVSSAHDLPTLPSDYLSSAAALSFEKAKARFAVESR